MANHHTRHAIKTGQTTDDGLIIGKITITMQFMEIGKDVVHIVHGVGTLWMTGNLRDLPRR